jgi:galactoside 2-L-fucosyltransferase 1/2
MLYGLTRSKILAWLALLIWVGVLYNWSSGNSARVVSPESHHTFLQKNIGRISNDSGDSEKTIPQHIDVKDQHWVEVCLSPHGYVGNSLFQYFSGLGIAKRNEMKLCICPGSIPTFQMILQLPPPPICPSGLKLTEVAEKHYAIYENFSLVQNTKLIGYFQSFKYFPGEISPTWIRDKLALGAETTARGVFSEVSPKKSSTVVGIHARRGDHITMATPYLRFPSNVYFNFSMNYFRAKYPDSLFLVASNNIGWCKSQAVFQNHDVRFIETGDAVADFATLAYSDHIIMSLGTFSWWAAYLSQGEVIYQPEFVMDHPINAGNVLLADYYLSSWKAVDATL